MVEPYPWLHGIRDQNEHVLIFVRFVAEFVSLETKLNMTHVLVFRGWVGRSKLAMVGGLSYYDNVIKMSSFFLMAPLKYLIHTFCSRKRLCYFWFGSRIDFSVFRLGKDYYLERSYVSNRIGHMNQPFKCEL